MLPYLNANASAATAKFPFSFTAAYLVIVEGVNRQGPEAKLSGGHGGLPR